MLSSWPSNSSSLDFSSIHRGQSNLLASCTLWCSSFDVMSISLVSGHIFQIYRPTSRAPDHLTLRFVDTADCSVTPPAPLVTAYHKVICFSLIAGSFTELYVKVETGLKVVR
ncbi:hypothetical protein FRC02_003911 [Tulasnella sp. 418]|nr:hypothetical protein FRC02_003911 [Tulasnella sp. 418]